MSRMVVGSKPFSRKSLSAEVRMFSRVASRLESLSSLVMFERVQKIAAAAFRVKRKFRRAVDSRQLAVGRKSPRQRITRVGIEMQVPRLALRALTRDDLP